MIIKNYIQGSQEWLDMRKNHIMASEAPYYYGVITVENSLAVVGRETRA
jgi:hypothetical protein